MLIVLKGLRGRSVGELRGDHGISQSQYYQWRDRFLAKAHKAFEPESKDQVTARLKGEPLLIMPVGQRG